MRLYNVRKWRYNSKKTGALVDLSCYDEEAEKWLNIKAHIPFASEYAGKDADELPATLCMVKDGVLIIKCRVFDDYTPQAREADEKDAKKAKGKGKPSRKETMDDDDISF